MTLHQEAAVRTAIPVITAIVVTFAVYLLFTFVPLQFIGIGLAAGVLVFLVYHMYQVNLYNITTERSTKEQ